MHKLGICRNLLVVLLRAFLTVPPQVQKRRIKKKNSDFFPFLGLLFPKLHWLNKEWEGAVLCWTQLRAGRGCASGTVPVQLQKSVGFPQLPADPRGGKGGLIWRHVLHSPGLHCSSW